MSQPVPKYLRDAAQGLAFWVGYKLIQQPWDKLSEGALHDELKTLIAANAGSTVKVEKEHLFRNLTKGTENDKMDLFIRATGASLGIAIEIKKYKGLSSIKADCKKLSRLLDTTNRCFVVAISQKAFPTQLVTQEGKAKPAPVWEENGWHATVRCVLKASASFKSKGAAHYICLIEVLRS